MKKRCTYPCDCLFVSYLQLQFFANVPAAQPSEESIAIGFSLLGVQQTVPAAGSSLSLSFTQQVSFVVNSTNRVLCFGGGQPIIASSVNVVVTCGVSHICTPFRCTHALLPSGSSVADFSIGWGLPQYVNSTSSSSCILGACKTSVQS